MSRAVTEPNSFPCSPTLRRKLNSIAPSACACACAWPLSFSCREAITAFSCSIWRRFLSLASTAILRGRRKFRPYPSFTVTISPLVPRAIAGDPARDDFAPLGDEILERRLILEVDLGVLLHAESANLLAAEAAPAALFLVEPVACAGGSAAPGVAAASVRVPLGHRLNPPPWALRP